MLGIESTLFDLHSSYKYTNKFDISIYIYNALKYYIPIIYTNIEFVTNTLCNI